MSLRISGQTTTSAITETSTEGAKREQATKNEEPQNISSNSTSNQAELETARSLAQAQKSILFSKLPNSNQATNATPAGVTVNIGDAKKAIAPDSNGKRSPNQTIRTGYEVSADGTRKTLSSNTAGVRSQRDQYLKLTDEKGNLTPLGKQLEAIKSDGGAVITEPGTNIRQLATLVNGSRPTPEQEAVILAGLVAKGLATVAIDGNGKVSFSIVPYRAASNKEIIEAGKQAQANFENIREILPGLKDIKNVAGLAAVVYASSLVQATTGSSMAAGVVSTTVDSVMIKDRLPTLEELAKAIILSFPSTVLERTGIKD